MYINVIYVQDCLNVYNFIFLVLVLVILSLLGCALGEEIFSWRGNDSQVDANENGEFKYKITIIVKVLKKN